MSKFEVGDRVWGMTDGWGIVTSNDPRNTLGPYPVEVTFDNGSEDSYTSNGSRYDDELRPTLFFDEVKAEDWPNPPKPKPDPATLVLNQEIMVKVLDTDNTFTRRLFAFADGSNVWYFADGADSRGTYKAFRASDWKPVPVKG